MADLDPTSPEYAALLRRTEAITSGRQPDPADEAVFLSVLSGEKAKELQPTGLGKRAELSGLSPREQLLKEQAEQTRSFYQELSKRQEELTGDFYREQNALRDRT